MTSLRGLVVRTVLASIVAVLAVSFAAAQKSVPAVKRRTALPAAAAQLPAVKQIDAAALKELIKPNNKPLLINFWATWCDPCREEFPDLVKINSEFGEKLDLIVVSLDDLAEINGDVPKFLAEMKANMPAFLLKTADESEAITAVSKDWKGGLPFTILFDELGRVSYLRQGKINVETVRAKITGLTTAAARSAAPTDKQK
ncbi:MAG: redoxin domain-containing protein [Acidobacteriota bacterium]